MKTNGDYKGNATLIGPPGGIYYQTWANYYLKFLQAYKQAGINFWGLTAQNEPTDGFIYKFGFNALGFTPETQSQFIVDNLGPTLEQNGFNAVKIMILDDQRLFLPAWPQRVLLNLFKQYPSFSLSFLTFCLSYRCLRFLKKRLNTYRESLFIGI